MLKYQQIAIDIEKYIEEHQAADKGINCLCRKP